MQICSTQGQNLGESFCLLVFLIAIKNFRQREGAPSVSPLPPPPPIPGCYSVAARGPTKAPTSAMYMMLLDSVGGSV